MVASASPKRHKHARSHRALRLGMLIHGLKIRSHSAPTLGAMMHQTTTLMLDRLLIAPARLVASSEGSARMDVRIWPAMCGSGRAVNINPTHTSQTTDVKMRLVEIIGWCVAARGLTL